MDGELLRQALMLTVIGMGMTFTAIGALVLGMYLLSGSRSRKAEAAAAPTEPEAVVAMAAPPADARYIAAAAAVAVARAQAMRAPRRDAAAPVDQWRSFVRSGQLAQRGRAIRSQTTIQKR